LSFFFLLASHQLILVSVVMGVSGVLDAPNVSPLLITTLRINLQNVLHSSRSKCNYHR